MVGKKIFLLNIKSQPSLDVGIVNNSDYNDVIVTSDNNDGEPTLENKRNFKKPKYKYVKVLVEDPFNNRDIILKVSKNQKGVYV